MFYNIFYNYDGLKKKGQKM